MQKVKIDTHGLMPAPIDETNIMSDALFDSIFDDGLYTSQRSDALGYISNLPSYATVFTNCIEVKPVTDNGVFHSDVWASLVIARLTGCAYNRLPPLGAADTKVQYAGENTSADISCVYTFRVNKNRLLAFFHWNVPKA